MAPADSGQRRGPPKARKDRPAATKPLPEEDNIEEGEWYEDVVDEAITIIVEAIVGILIHVDPDLAK